MNSELIQGSPEWKALRKKGMKIKYSIQKLHIGYAVIGKDENKRIVEMTCFEGIFSAVKFKNEKKNE